MQLRSEGRRKRCGGREAMTPNEKLRIRTVKANMTNKRCFVVGFDDTTGRIDFKCKQDHQFSKVQKDWNRILGFLRKVTRQPDGYWTERGGGVSTLCPKCWRLKQKELKSRVEKGE